jgi:type I restriction enzyme S subunit
MSWGKVKIDNLCSLLSGNAWSASKFKDEGILPIIRIQNLGNNVNEKYIWWNESYDKRFVVTKGDILLSLSGSIKVDEWNGEPGLLNQRIVKLSPKEGVDKRWFFWQINSIILEIEKMGKWALVNNVSISDLKELEIPLPPLETQKRIANILDAADALRQKDQELLKKYDELAQAIFIDMFGDPVKNEKGWEKVKLSYFIDKLETGVSVNSTDEDFSVDKKCVLKTSCVYTGYFNPNEAKVIVLEEINRAKLNPQKESILISRMNTRELVGMSAYVDSDYSNLYLPDRLWMTLKSENKHSVLWLSYALKSNAIRDQLLKIASGTSGSMKNISKKDFLDLEIFNPSFEFQERFEKCLTSINFLKNKSSMSNGNLLFSALLQKAFNGSL